MHKLLGHDLTWDSDYRYKLLLRGVKRYLGTAVQRKAPITPRLLLRIVHLFDFDKPLHVAMWVVSYAAVICLVTQRSSPLTAAHIRATFLCRY